MRVQFGGNKHFYQRFSAGVGWGQAKGNCEALGAHLVTLTSIDEASFVLALARENNQSSYLWLGATDSAIEEQPTWITGEKMTYGYWYPGANTDFYDLVFLETGDGLWRYSFDGEVRPQYICEWSANTYVGVTKVPDLNGNGVPEVAALYVDYVNGKHTVKIRDPKTDKDINTLTFSSSFTVPPSGPVVIKDINGNGVPEIGVLYAEGGKPTVGIKDAKNNKTFVKKIKFLNATFTPKEISVYQNTNGNGAAEITVLGVGKTTVSTKSETRNIKTGALVDDTRF